jgi:hypothetical protein
VGRLTRNGKEETTMTTRERIEALRENAGIAGDLEMVRVCDRALERGERSKAWRECLRVLADGDAQIDD